MKKYFLFLSCLFAVQSAFAGINAKINWSKYKNVYEVMLMTEETQSFSAGQITIKYPTENTFTYDIQSELSGVQIISKRYNAPKECPTCDFQTFSFRNQIDLQGKFWKILFTFKIAGPVNDGYVEISKLPQITINEQKINISNLLNINSLGKLITVDNQQNKVPIISSSNTPNMVIQNFTLSIDYLYDDVIINTNWHGAENDLIFYFYDENGILQFKETKSVEQGAQRFDFDIENIPIGKYFVKVQQGSWEMLLNEGFLKK
jgi:hypothetical protein